MLACSSAGGGLRIAVVGNEELVTAEAGRRVALSSGGKVVARARGRPRRRPAAASRGRAGPTSCCSPAAPTAATPRRCSARARGLAPAGWRGPVVVAGNVDARDEVAAILGAATPLRARRQRRAPDRRARARSRPGPRSARCSCRHVIGGKHLSKRADFTAMVQGRDARRRAHRRRAARPGLTTLARAPATSSSSTSAAPPPTCTAWSSSTPRTPGWPARWSPPPRSPAPSRATSACAGRRVDRRSRRPGLDDLAGRRRAHGTTTRASCPTTDAERDDDEAIARAAVGLALRRHAGRSQVVVSPEGRVVERTGKDLREVDLLVGSGGVLRHGRPGVAARVLAGSVGADVEGGWQLPRRAAAWSSTPTTCWPRPGCSPRAHPRGGVPPCVLAAGSGADRLG